MKTIHIIMIIGFSILILSAVLIIIYKIKNERIKKLEYIINDTKKSIIDILNNKQNLLLSMIKILEENMKVKNKLISQINKRKNKEINFDDDELLNKCFIEINNVQENEPQNKKLKIKISEYEDNQLHLISLRTYYNKYTLIYNNLIRKLPYVIISKIKKYKPKSLFDGEELENRNIIEV